VEQSHDLTNRNRIRGSFGRTSGLMIAKSISIKVQSCKSGRCVAKAVMLTSGGLSGVPDSGLRESRGFLSAIQESAEAIVGQQPEGPNGMEW
jgi:hypothetical protein